MHIQIVTHFLKKYKALLLYIAVFLGFFLLSGESLFAAEPESGISQENIDKAVEILNGVITLAAALMGMITGFITMFLYPGWTNGTLFGLQEYLKEIWILISNVIYFVFAFILIAIAFMNIIGKGEGTWELKQAMPKFIVGVLIVPFSWFFVQFILSISAILTVGVLTLPYDSFGNKDLFQKALADQEFADQKICKDIIISFSGDFTGYDTGDISTEETELDEKIKCRTNVGDGGGGGKITIRELITGQNKDGTPSADGAGLQNSIFGIISIYSYGILKIDQLDTINNGDLEAIKTGADLVFKIVFDVLFVIVYLILMVALLLALFVRGVRLWIYMMLSPVFGLLYFLGSEGVGDAENKFSIKEFIHLALIPVYVSAALAFGLVFILVSAKGITLDNPDEPDMLRAGGFSITMIGAQGGSENEEVKGSIIGKLIMQIFGVVILWISVMFALSRSEVTKAVTAPIADFGKSVGKLAAAAPTYAPIIPSSLGGSAAGLQSMGAGVTSGVDSYFRGKGSERGASFAESLTPGGAGGGAGAAMRTTVNNEQVGLGNREAGSINRVLGSMREQGNSDTLSNSNVRRDFVTALAEAMGKNSSGELNLSTAEQSRLSTFTGETFVTEVQKAVNDGSNEFLGETARTLTTFFDGTTPGSVSREQIDSAFSLGIINTTPQTPQAPTGQQQTTTASTVTINVNGTPTTAGSYLQGVGITERDGLVEELENRKTSGILNQSNVNAILAAFDEGADTSTT